MKEEANLNNLDKTKIKQQNAVSIPVRKPYYYSSLIGLSPAKLRNILKDAKEGRWQAFLTLAEEMEERDPQYRTVLNTRKLR